MHPQHVIPVSFTSIASPLGCNDFLAMTLVHEHRLFWASGEEWLTVVSTTTQVKTAWQDRIGLNAIAQKDECAQCIM